MALPQQLQTARMNNSTLGSSIDDGFGNFEKALAAILGFALDTDITASPFGCDNSGRLTNALIRQKAAGPVGHRFLDSTSGKEFRLALSNTDIVIDENTGSEGAPTWTNRITIPIATGVLPVIIKLVVVNSVTIASTAVETSFGKTTAFAANSFKVGDTVEIDSRVTLTNALGTPHTFTLKNYLGPRAHAVAVSVPGSSVVELALKTQFVILLLGVGGTVQSGVSVGFAAGIAPSPDTTSAAFDTTSSQNADCKILMDSSSASLSAQLRYMAVRLINAGSTS